MRRGSTRTVGPGSRPGGARAPSRGSVGTAGRGPGSLPEVLAPSRGVCETPSGASEGPQGLARGRSPVYPRAWVIAVFGQAPLKCLVFVFQSPLARLSRVWKEQRGSPGGTVVQMGYGSNSERGKGKRVSVPFLAGHGCSQLVFCNLIHQRALW